MCMCICFLLGTLGKTHIDVVMKKPFVYDFPRGFPHVFSSSMLVYRGGNRYSYNIKESPGIEKVRLITVLSRDF